jgi:hypothetical protein
MAAVVIYVLPPIALLFAPRRYVGATLSPCCRGKDDYSQDFALGSRTKSVRGFGI